MFFQRMIRLPAAQARLQAGPAQSGRALLDLLAPETRGTALLGSFWLHAANHKHPERGSGMAPPQPQFRGVAVRPRARVQCVRVGQTDGCLEVEVVFGAAGEDPHGPLCPGRPESWKLRFGCTPDARVLVEQLCS